MREAIHLNNGREFSLSIRNALLLTRVLTKA